jgi:hypothetical protein
MVRHYQYLPTANTLHIAALALQVAIKRASGSGYTAFSGALFLAAALGHTWPHMLPPHIAVLFRQLAPVAFTNSIAVDTSFSIVGWFVVPELFPGIRRSRGMSLPFFLAGEALLHRLPAVLALALVLRDPGAFMTPLTPYAGLHSCVMNLVWGATVQGFAPGDTYTAMAPSSWRACWLTAALCHIAAGELLVRLVSIPSLKVA